jgi:hypothetical protein
MVDGLARDGRQAEMLLGLLRPSAYAHPVQAVELIETHISRVLLAGDFAYKLKRPLNLGFADFSSLERRRFFCDEEIRLNRRLAPDFYLGVVPITGPPESPAMNGDGDVLEYAVQMRRFPQRALLSNLSLDRPMIDAIVDRVADFHQSVPTARGDSPYGTPEAVLAPMRENFSQIREAAVQRDTLASIARLERWTLLMFRHLEARLQARRQGGYIRECHGDLHRGNIAVVAGEPVIFDCIDFNPRLRWIDTMSELAFLVMDLHEGGQSGLARRALNRYLVATGDYGGLAVLRFYQVYRAMVRAKVIAIRLAQGGLRSGAERDRACAELRRYLRIARGTAVRGPRRLIIACGLSGSGKTWLATRLGERLPLIHIRSDVERKRLFGLPPNATTASRPGGGIYTEDAGRLTYARLLRLAREIILAGYGVLVDATFLKAAQRGPFRELAAELGCPFTILALDAPNRVLLERVTERMRRGGDASEAGPAVLELQIQGRQRLNDRERASAIHLDSSKPIDFQGLLARLAAHPCAAAGAG